MSKKIRNAIVIVGTLSLMVFAVSALAAISGTSGDQSISLTNPLSCSDFGCVAKGVISLLADIAIPICSLMVLWGAFELITSAGNPEKVKTGGRTILYATLGFAAIIAAKYVVPLIIDILEG